MNNNAINEFGSKGGAVVRALASHQCGPGSNPGVDMWVEFVVGSLLCSERFFSGYFGFPLSSKTNTSKFQFDLERTDTEKRVHKLLGATRVNESHFFTFLHLHSAFVGYEELSSYYKVRQFFYYKMRQFYYKLRRLLQSATEHCYSKLNFARS